MLRRATLAALCALASASFLSHGVGSPPVSIKEDDFTFIDNGIIRVGVDLTRGGSIGYLADSRTRENIINCYDMGREVQLSFYGGPDPYNPPTKDYSGGACDKLFLQTDWPWNPIGAGDIDGNHGKILNLTSDSTSVHVISTPLQWACHNVPCECEFEQRIALEGTGVHVTATLHNRRTDAYDESIAYSQELPAVYTNGGYYRLLSYNGSSPFQQDALTEFPIAPPPQWLRLQGTENWVAQVNANGWGLAVVNPDQTYFAAGFNGNPGKGGPSDNAAGYIAPLASLALKHDETYTFEYYLVLGDLPTLRSYAYQVMGHGSRTDADLRRNP